VSKPSTQSAAAAEPGRLKRMRVQIAAVLILLLGVLQMVGDLFSVPELKGIGAASMASPAPKVFSSVKGLETFSTRIYLEWTGTDGSEQSVEFDSDGYAKLQGPYNRRNIYGAALAYGPVLAQDERARPMLKAVLAYALTGHAPLLHELGIDPRTVRMPMTLRYESLPGTNLGELPTTLQVPLR
jgi:hypothetical protein